MLDGGAQLAGDGPGGNRRSELRLIRVNRLGRIVVIDANVDIGVGILDGSQGGHDVAVGVVNLSSVSYPRNPWI